MMFNEAATNIGKGNCLVTQGQFDGNRVEREREREREEAILLMSGLDCLNYQISRE
jgi:hypothetical protein